MAEPVKGIAYTFPVALSKNGSFVTNPTIAAGDFTRSLDGATFANLTTLPAVTPTGSTSVLVSLSAAEMNGEKLVVKGVDLAGSNWEPTNIFIDIPAGSSESVIDILEGDVVESSISLVVNKKDTSTALISKTITGSLLSSGVTVTTKEST